MGSVLESIFKGLRFLAKTKFCLIKLENYSLTLPHNGSILFIDWEKSLKISKFEPKKVTSSLLNAKNRRQI